MEEIDGTYTLGFYDEIIDGNDALKTVALKQVGEDKYELTDGERRQIENMLEISSRPDERKYIRSFLNILNMTRSKSFEENPVY